MIRFPPQILIIPAPVPVPVPIPTPIEVQREPELVRTGAALKWMYILAVITGRVAEVSR